MRILYSTCTVHTSAQISEVVYSGYSAWQALHPGTGSLPQGKPRKQCHIQHFLTCAHVKQHSTEHKGLGNTPQTATPICTQTVAIHCS